MSLYDIQKKIQELRDRNKYAIHRSAYDFCLAGINIEIDSIMSRLSKLEKERKESRFDKTTIRYYETDAKIDALRGVLGKKMKNKSLLEYKDDIKKHFGIDVINIREKKL